MKKKYLFFIVFNLILFQQSVFGNHLVGSSLSMQQIDNVAGKYKITLHVFINVDHFVANEEDLMKVENNYVRVIRKKDNLYLPVPRLTFEKFESLIHDNPACEHANGLHTREYRYTAIVQWDINNFDDDQGYYLAYERCCRDKNVTNIDMPEETGMVAYLEFPSLKKYPNYSSPSFPLFNGEFICANKLFTFNFAATDADGDVLKYSLVTPWKGNSASNNPRPIAEAAPYAKVAWFSGYSENNSINGTPGLSIDPNTGKLTVKANQTGLFIFTVQVDKYRDNKWIGLVRHDFQFFVSNCSSKTPPTPVITQGNQAVQSVEVCNGSGILLETQYNPDWAYQWQKNGENIPNAKFSTLNVTERGEYTVIKSFKNECATDIGSQAVKVTDGGVAANIIFNPIPLICTNDKVNLSASPPNGIFTGDGVSNTIFDPSLAGVGKHQLTYSTSSQSGCAASKSITVEVKSPISLGLPDEIRTKPNEVIIIPTVPSQPDLTFMWTPAEGLNNQYIASPTLTVTENLTYTVIAKSPDGCEIKDEVKIITDINLVISNAFTPNGDRLNDFWIIKGIEDLPECEVSVYNSWGELIFYSKGYTTSWDGKYKGKEVPGGMYLYSINTRFFRVTLQLFIELN